MITPEDKQHIVMQYNASHETAFQYNAKYDVVCDELSGHPYPVRFDSWYKTYIKA